MLVAVHELPLLQPAPELELGVFDAEVFGAGRREWMPAAVRDELSERAAPVLAHPAG